MAASNPPPIADPTPPAPPMAVVNALAPLAVLKRPFAIGVMAATIFDIFLNSTPPITRYSNQFQFSDTHVDTPTNAFVNATNPVATSLNI